MIDITLSLTDKEAKQRFEVADMIDNIVSRKKINTSDEILALIFAISYLRGGQVNVNE